MWLGLTGPETLFIGLDPGVGEDGILECVWCTCRSGECWSNSKGGKAVLLRGNCHPKRDPGVGILEGLPFSFESDSVAGIDGGV